jgi:HAD superfamily hydrolase (TIGR01490 family)
VARKFAVFDIDGTVIRWQLFHSIVNELINRGQLSAKAEREIKTSRMTWKRREHEDSFTAYEHVLVHAYLDALGHMDSTEHQSAVESVFAEYKEQTYTYTRDLIHQLKAQGYLLFAISGSQQEIVEKFADYYGFDHAIGARLERLGDAFTGNITSPARGKQAALDAILNQYDLLREGSIAVGDTASDMVLLEAVEQPIAFNPNSELFAAAKAHGWKIVLERKNVVYELEKDSTGYRLIS